MMLYENIYDEMKSGDMTHPL